MFGEFGAAGLKLRRGGEALDGGRVGAMSKHFAKGFDAIGAENHVRSDRQIEGIPLGAAWFSSE